MVWLGTYELYFLNDFKFLFPEIFLALGISIILTFGLLYHKTILMNKSDFIDLVNKLSILCLFLTSLLVINCLDINNLLINGQFLNNYYTSFIKVLLLLSGIIIIFLWTEYSSRENMVILFEYAILILLAILGMIILISSNDLLILYLAIELQSLSLYILATFKKNSTYSTEAGLKYFVLGAVSSGILLFGMSLVYGFTGMTNFDDLSYLLIYTTNLDLTLNGIFLGSIFIVIALFFKLAVAPFHMWAPDVYEGSPTITTAFFAIVPKIAIFGILVRFYSLIFSTIPENLSLFFLYTLLATLIIGTFGALYQIKVKRLLAYSAIVHVGYMLIGLYTNTIDGFYGILLYQVIYIIISMGIFSIIISLRHKKNNQWLKLRKITEFKNLLKSNPVLGISFCLLLFSIAGIPPLAGFYSKLYIFFAAMKSEMYLIALFGVIISVIGAFYYLRLIKITMFNQQQGWALYYPISKSVSYIIALVSLINLFLFINPNYIFMPLNFVIFSLFS